MVQYQIILHQSRYQEDLLGATNHELGLIDYLIQGLTKPNSMNEPKEEEFYLASFDLNDLSSIKESKEIEQQLTLLKNQLKEQMETLDTLQKKQCGMIQLKCAMNAKFEDRPVHRNLMHAICDCSSSSTSFEFDLTKKRIEVTERKIEYFEQKLLISKGK